MLTFLEPFLVIKSFEKMKNVETFHEKQTL